MKSSSNKQKPSITVVRRPKVGVRRAPEGNVLSWRAQEIYKDCDFLVPDDVTTDYKDSTSEFTSEEEYVAELECVDEQDYHGRSSSSEDSTSDDTDGTEDNAGNMVTVVRPRYVRDANVVHLIYARYLRC